MKYISNKSISLETSSLDNDRMSKEEIRSLVKKICYDVRDNKVFDRKIKIIYFDYCNVEKSTIIEKIWWEEDYFVIRMESGKELRLYSLSDVQEFINPMYAEVNIKKIIICPDGE